MSDKELVGFSADLLLQQTNLAGIVHLCPNQDLVDLQRYSVHIAASRYILLIMQVAAGSPVLGGSVNSQQLLRGRAGTS